MFEIGEEILVFKEKNVDYYHRRGEYVKGVILKKYPYFYLVEVKKAYKECFYESEIYRYDKDIKSRKEHIN